MVPQQILGQVPQEELEANPSRNTLGGEILGYCLDAYPIWQSCFSGFKAFIAINFTLLGFVVVCPLVLTVYVVSVVSGSRLRRVPQG